LVANETFCGNALGEGPRCQKAVAFVAWRLSGEGRVANLAIISCRSRASPTNPIGFVHTNPISRLLDLLLLALTWSEGVGYLKKVKLGGHADGSPAGSIGFDRRLG